MSLSVYGAGADLSDNLISSASLQSLSDFVQTGAASTTFTLVILFTASANLLGVTANATYHNLTLGTINHVDVSSNAIQAGGRSNITSTALPFNLNIDLLTNWVLAVESLMSTLVLWQVYSDILNALQGLQVTLAVTSGGAFEAMFSQATYKDSTDLELSGAADGTTETPVGDVPISGTAFDVASSIAGLLHRLPGDNFAVTIQGDSSSTPFTSLQPALKGVTLTTSIAGLDVAPIISHLYAENALAPHLGYDINLSFETFSSFVIPQKQTVDRGRFGNVEVVNGALWI
ncbi:hypothetical protein BDR07DRAFT_1386341 [Suillus spraguei]|nr:hypothetical protein BDR07DRAFT_1386337 [Suillus spraguei]KAG2351248.1 hypothetical protein BDR07DRAFT_1386341 [Suillus spraguei]